ncbi:MAG: VOC family protein [Haliea sp.]
MKPRISMITLGVNDLQRSVQFYELGLGFPRMDSPPEVAFFTLNGTWLGLYGRDALAEDALVDPASVGFAGFTLAHNVGSRQEVDQIMDQAVSLCAVVTKPAKETDWGGYAGYFSDPDGYLWEIAHNPLFWVGPSDESP